MSIYRHKRTRYRRAESRTGNGYVGGLLLTEPPYWYRIPSTFRDPTVESTDRLLGFLDNTRRAPLPLFLLAFYRLYSTYEPGCRVRGHERSSTWIGSRTHIELLLCSKYTGCSVNSPYTRLPGDPWRVNGWGYQAESAYFPLILYVYVSLNQVILFL